MAYVLPQLTVTQEFARSPVSTRNRQRAALVGPAAHLVRYTEAGERAAGKLGRYDPQTDTDFAWPDRPAGAAVDTAYARLFAVDALLAYYADPVGGGGNVVADRTGGRTNRVKATNLVWATNGAAAASAGLGDRGVKVGDVVRVTGALAGGGTGTVWSYVKALAGDPSAAVVGAASADPNNAGAAVSAAPVTFVSGAENCVGASALATAYDPHPTGLVSETYDVLVTQGSTGGDLTTAKVRVLSASGLDDHEDVTPAAAGVYFALGGRGATFRFTYAANATCSSSATADAVPPHDLVVGQRWRVAVTAGYTPAAATSGGTYTGPTSVTYLARVVRGGKFAADLKPQIAVTAADGSQAAPPVAVTAAATPVAVGAYGVTLAFAGTGLRKGDVFAVAVTAAAAGPLRAIDLGHSLPADLADGTPVAVDLYLRRAEVEVPRWRPDAPNVANWVAGADALTAAAGATVADPEWTVGGQVVPLPLWADPAQKYTQLYAHYRAWRTAGAGGWAETDLAGLDAAVPGPTHPDNPLKFALSLTLANSGGATVLYCPVGDPAGEAGWATALENAFEQPDLYHLVPLTDDPAVHALCHAHVLAASGQSTMLWRTLWLGMPSLPVVPVVHGGSAVPGHTAATTADGLTALGTLADDPAAAGTQYTRFKVTSGNADLLALGVRAGDTLRVNFTPTADGGMTYDEFTVDAVPTESELLLAAGPAAGIGVAARFEVWRALTPAEEAAAVSRIARGFGDRRTRAVWPGEVVANAAPAPSWAAAAAVAGLASGSLPHRPLTRVEVANVAVPDRVRARFGKGDLDLLSGGGVWVLTRAADGRTYTRDAVSTAPYAEFNGRYEVTTRNFDSVSFRYRDTLDPYIGVSNVTDTVREQILLDIEKLNLQLRNESTPGLGPQVNAVTVLSLAVDPTAKDHYILQVEFDLPEPLNVIDARLRLVL